MLEGTQLSMQDVNNEYKAFVDKFKPKKTTDDCYTPPNVYEAVLKWVRQEYGIAGEVVRPFWPGGDYKRYPYPEGCTVVDNPPFSILAQICRTYMQNGIRFFLFAPYLTNFSVSMQGLTHVITPVSVIYENGAEIDTAFLTNLEPGVEVRTAPDLYRLIKAADDENRKKLRKELPKYSYPPEVMTSSMVGYISRYGGDFRVGSEECMFIRSLESQRKAGKSLFGGGYLLSEKAAAEKAAAEKAAAQKAAAQVWELSEKEKEAVRNLGKRSGT